MSAASSVINFNICDQAVLDDDESGCEDMPPMLRDSVVVDDIKKLKTKSRKRRSNKSKPVPIIDSIQPGDAVLSTLSTASVTETIEKQKILVVSAIAQLEARHPSSVRLFSIDDAEKAHSMLGM